MTPAKLRARPAWVWVISIFFFISVSWNILSYYLVYSGVFPLEPTQEALLGSFTVVDHSLSVAIAVLNLAGALSLFLLRRRAYHFFLAALSLNLVTMIWYFVARGGVRKFLEATGWAGLIGQMMGLGLLTAVWLYARKLKKSGVLS